MRNDLTITYIDAKTFSELLFLDDNNLAGDLDSICTPLNVFMVADCRGGPGGAASIEIRCSCCEKCCSKNDPCNDATLIPHDSDPTWRSKYQRYIYKFGLSEEYHFNASDGGRW
jgi:hypothetical protein